MKQLDISKNNFNLKVTHIKINFIFIIFFILLFMKCTSIYIEVNVQLGKEVSASDLFGYDAVVLATGLILLFYSFYGYILN